MSKHVLSEIGPVFHGSSNAPQYEVVCSCGLFRTKPADQGSRKSWTRAKAHQDAKEAEDATEEANP